MTFLAGGRLLFLLLIVAAGALVVWFERRSTNDLARFTDPAMLAWLSPRRPGMRRAAASALLVATLAALVVASARPARTVEVPVKIATVIVALDRSTSMAAKDVKPTRIAAAKNAATRFIRGLPSYFRVGVVLFSGVVDVAVAPTVDRTLALDAVKHAKLDDSTAIGDAIFTSLDALTQDAGQSSTGPIIRPVYPKLKFAAIVLLSDGATTSGRPDTWAAGAARHARVSVSTIAFGTSHGVLDDDTTVPVDADALQSISDRTGGAAFRAENEAELLSVFDRLGFRLAYHTEPREVTQWAIGVALALALLTAVLALSWFARLP